MRRLFISQPMAGRDDTQILQERQKAIEEAKTILEEEVEVIDSFLPGKPVDAGPLWYLAKSLELLATADAVYFAKGWEAARGCQIERACAVRYGIPIVRA